MQELHAFEIHPQEIEGAHMILMYHRSKPVVTVLSNDLPKIQEFMREGYTRGYQHQEFPKALYRKDGQRKVVYSREEQKAAGKEWSEKPTVRPAWDKRDQPQGFSLDNHHLAFLKHHGFDVKTVEDVTAWFASLQDAEQEAFLRDAEQWIPEQKRTS